MICQSSLVVRQPLKRILVATLSRNQRNPPRHSSPVGTRHVISGRRPSSLSFSLSLSLSPYLPVGPREERIGGAISRFSPPEPDIYSDGKATRGKTYRTRFLLRRSYIDVYMRRNVYA